MPALRRRVLLLSAAVSVLAAALAFGLHWGSHTPPAAAAMTTVQIGDTWFCDASHTGGNRCDTTINAGDTVTWNFTGQLPHTTTACGASCTNPVPQNQALWHSGVLNNGASFQHTFDTPGEYLYYCQVHSFEMRGKIIVQGPAGTPTPTRTRPPTPTRTPTPSGRAGDVNCSGGAADSVDGALILQLGAGLVSSLRCQQNGDVNGDRALNALDAALVLQFSAGLLDHLPV